MNTSDRNAPIRQSRLLMSNAVLAHTPHHIIIIILSVPYKFTCLTLKKIIMLFSVGMLSLKKSLKSKPECYELWIFLFDYLLASLIASFSVSPTLMRKIKIAVKCFLESFALFVCIMYACIFNILITPFSMALVYQTGHDAWLVLIYVCV